MKLIMTVSITHTHLLIHHWLAEERQRSWTIWSLKNRQFWVRVTVWSHSHSGLSWGKTFRHKAILLQPSERICGSSKWKYWDKHPMFNNRVSQWQSNGQEVILSSHCICLSAHKTSCQIPVCLRGASPNRSLTTARALSERANTSCSSSWSEKTCSNATQLSLTQHSTLKRYRYTCNAETEKSETEQIYIFSQHCTYLPDDAETGLVQGCRAPCVPETSFQGFLFQLPLSCCFVVRLVELMPMTLNQKNNQTILRPRYSK